MTADLLRSSIAITLLLTFARAEYDVNKYCQLTQPGTKLPSLESCQTYYHCMGNDMVVKSSCSGNEAFDKDAQSCVPESESNCYFGLANPCYKKDNQFAYCSYGCNWYNYCVDGEIAGNGTCLVGQKFYAANGSCIFGECDSNSEADVQDTCDIMPEGVFFGDFENCRAWHKCVAMNQVNGFCEGSLVYDVASGYCLAYADKICQRTKNIVQGQASGPPPEACTSVGQVVGDTNVCSLYYSCEMATQNPAVTYNWVQKSCKTQYFDVISGSCSGTLPARVYPGCDRCELKTGYSRTYWANAVDPNCAQYFTCNNGQKVGGAVRSCREGAFFDEGAQACVGNEEILEQYALHNGACQDYTCTNARICSLQATSNTDPPPPVNTEKNVTTEKKKEEVTKKPEESPVNTENNATTEIKKEEETKTPEDSDQTAQQKWF